MATVLEPALERAVWNAEQLAERFGPIPLNRIGSSPAPGLATEEDAIEVTERKERICELVDGILVEKVMGAFESLLAVEIARLIGNFAKPGKLGVVLGEAGMLKLATGLIRIPDVAFLSKQRFPGGRLPRAAAWPVAPDLAVEIISEGNTKKEMAEKLGDYFAAGAKLVWYVYPTQRHVEVFASPESKSIVKHDGILDGGDVLPGLEINLGELFADLPVD